MDIHREQFQSTEGNREHYPFSSSGTELFAYNSRKDLLQLATYSAPIRTYRLMGRREEETLKSAAVLKSLEAVWLCR